MNHFDKKPFLFTETYNTCWTFLDNLLATFALVTNHTLGLYIQNSPLSLSSILNGCSEEENYFAFQWSWSSIANSSNILKQSDINISMVDQNGAEFALFLALSFSMERKPQKAHKQQHRHPVTFIVTEIPPTFLAKFSKSYFFRVNIS